MQLSKQVNKSLVKDNAKSFADHEGHSRDLMRCARWGPPALSRCHIHAVAFIYTSAFAQQNLCSSCHCIHAAALTPQHLRRTYATAFT